MEAGFQLARRYRLERCLGGGGMVEVWRATDEMSATPVAVKLFGAESQAGADVRRRLLDAARSAARLRHPHIVEIHDFRVAQISGGTAADGDAPTRAVPYIVMELLTGETLADRIGRGAPSTVEAVRTCGQLAEALAAAHRVGITHDGLRPENVFRTARGAKVTDFGIAQALRDGSATEPAQPDPDADGTASVQPRSGTRAHVPPEFGRGAPSAAADVYALGVILVQALTGRQDLPASLPVGLPVEVASLCSRCRADDPADRPPAAEAAEVLLRFARVLERPVRVSKRPARTPPRVAGGQAGLDQPALVQPALAAAGEAAAERAQPGRRATDHTRTDHAGTDHAGTDHAGTHHTATDGAGPDQAAPDPAASDQAAPDQAETDQVETGHAATHATAEPPKAEHATTGHVMTGHVMTGHVVTGRVVTDHAATRRTANDQAAMAAGSAEPPPAFEGRESRDAGPATWLLDELAPGQAQAAPGGGSGRPRPPAVLGASPRPRGDERRRRTRRYAAAGLAAAVATGAVLLTGRLVTGPSASEPAGSGGRAAPPPATAPPADLPAATPSSSLDTTPGNAPPAAPSATPSATGSPAPGASAVIPALARMRFVVQRAQATGEIRSDVALDFQQVIGNLQADLRDGEQVDLRQRVGELSVKIANRLREGGISHRRALELWAILATVQLNRASVSGSHSRSEDDGHSGDREHGSWGERGHGPGGGGHQDGRCCGHR